VQVVNALSDSDLDFYTFIGLAATRDAVWTVAVVGDRDGVASRLLRIDIETGNAVPIELQGVIGQLSPPTTDGETVWTASEGGLHRITSAGVATSVPLDFVPMELTIGDEGIWIARDGGTTLVDSISGAVVRSIDSSDGNARLVGAPAPASGVFWQCGNSGILTRIDPLNGDVTATLPIPGNAAASCRSPVRTLVGAEGIEGLVPTGANAVVNPSTGAVELSLGISGSWTDFFVLEGSLWFIKSSTSSQNDVALLRIDPESGEPHEFAIDGTLHLNTTFDSSYVAIAGDWLWILADGSGINSADASPTLIRVPLSELGTLGD
jgi:hypothetical protein